MHVFCHPFYSEHEKSTQWKIIRCFGNHSILCPSIHPVFQQLQNGFLHFLLAGVVMAAFTGAPLTARQYLLLVLTVL